MAKKPLTVAAFEIGPSCLKFVEMPRNERRVLAVGIFPLEAGRWSETGYLAAQIRTALDTVSRGIVSRLVVSVPLGRAHLRVIDVPEEADPRDYVRWELSRYLARPLGAYAVDFQIEEPVPLVDADGTPVENPDASDANLARRHLAVAFAREEAVALRDSVERATALPLSALDVDAAAVVNAFALAYPEHLADRTIVIHANTEVISLIRTRQGTFQGAQLRRDAGNALRAGAETQERAEGLLRAVRGIVEALVIAEGDRHGGWNRPDRIFLCGDLAVDADFKELLRGSLPEGFSLLNPYRNMPGPDPADFPDAYPGARLCAATGLALRAVEES